MYAVVESGGKQYRVEEGTVLVVDRLEAGQGDKVTLRPVMVSGDDLIVTAKELDKIKIEAKVTEHLRGDKIKVFKYKAKKGYSRRAGHRSELTKLEITSLGDTKKKAAPKKETAKPAAPKTAATKAVAKKPASKKAAPKKAAPKKAAPKKAAPKKAAPKKAAPKMEPAPVGAAGKTSEKKEADDGA